MGQNLSELIGLLAIVAGSAAAVAGLAALTAWLKRRAQEQAARPAGAPLPLEAQVEQALQPYLFAGICAAYRVGEWAMDRAGKRLHAADKAAIARAVYRLLPDRIGEFDLTVVKRLVPPDRFARLVQDAFDRFDAQFMQSQARYQELFAAWVAEQKAKKARSEAGPRLKVEGGGAA